MSTRICYFLFFTMALLMTGLPAAVSYADKVEKLYIEALHIFGGNANVVSKWQNEIRFVVFNDGNTTDAADYANLVVTEASEIAGLKLTFPSHELSVQDYLLAVTQNRRQMMTGTCDETMAGCFNFVVFITTPKTMLDVVKTVPLRPVYQQALQNSPDLSCFFSPHHQGRQRITKSFIYVDSSLEPELLRTCLQEEIFQSFGLYNDVSDSEYFSFNNVVAPKNLTEYDKTLLAALYDPKVKPGFPVDTVVRIFLGNLGL